MMDNFYVNLAHVLLFAGVISTPLYINQEDGYYIYYYALLLILSWGINDSSCVLTSVVTKNGKIKLNNGPTVKLLNDVGIKTNKKMNYGVRLLTTFATIGTFYYYSSRSNYQKLAAWCMGWTMLTTESLRYMHINKSGMETDSFNTIIRRFQRESENFLK